MLEPGPQNSTPSPSVGGLSEQRQLHVMVNEKKTRTSLHTGLLGHPDHTLLMPLPLAGIMSATHGSQLAVQIRRSEGQLSMSLINKKWEVN